MEHTPDYLCSFLWEHLHSHRTLLSSLSLLQWVAVALWAEISSVSKLPVILREYGFYRIIGTEQKKEVRKAPLCFKFQD
jgi:hypothetical protein